MLEAIHDYYAYGFVLALLLIGLAGMLLKKNLMKKIIGMTIFQTAIILFYIVGAFKWSGTVPVLREPGQETPSPEQYINPLPHTLMLTAIVVGVATVGVALALIISIYRRFQTLDEPTLIERMK